MAPRINVLEFQNAGDADCDACDRVPTDEVVGSKDAVGSSRRSGKANAGVAVREALDLNQRGACIHGDEGGGGGFVAGSVSGADAYRVRAIDQIRSPRAILGMPESAAKCRVECDGRAPAQAVPKRKVLLAHDRNLDAGHAAAAGIVSDGS